MALFPLSDLLSGGSKSLRTELTGSKERLVITTTTLSTQVDVGGSEATNILSTAGTIATLMQFWAYALAPAGATSGTHKISIGIGSLTDSFNYLFEVQAAYNKTVRIGLTAGLGSDTTVVTGNGYATFAEFQNAVQRGLIKFGATATDRLIVMYTNNTDANQTGTRKIYHEALEKAVIW